MRPTLAALLAILVPWLAACAPQPLGPAAAVDFEAPYALDTGDRLRVMVFGQDGLSNSYAVDAAGKITMPLIGAVRARGLTTGQLSDSVATRLRPRAMRARPSRRPDPRCPLGGNPGTSRASRARAASRPRIEPRRHEPPHRLARHFRIPSCRTPGGRGGARRRARPRRQGRRLRASSTRTRSSRLYAAWRQPAFRPPLAARICLSDARARARRAHRAIAVGK